MSSLSAEERKRLLEELPDEDVRALLYDWGFWARPKQLPPPGDWATWVLRCGRGFGKTRTGVGWTHRRALEHPGRWIALIARTPADARDYMVEGPGGYLRNTAPDERPLYEPSKRRLTWPNGSWATIYSDDEPDQLRGFSGDTAWFDEFAKYKNPRECWDNLQFGMREASGDRPRRLITTTPRPLKILRDIEALPGTIVVTGSSYENADNLDPTWLEETLAQYAGTRTGRQEIEGELLDDAAGALWRRARIDELRKPADFKPDLVRVVVAVDPAVTSGEDSDETGIVVVGKGVNGHAYILADRSCRMSPAGWAARAVTAFDDFEADCIVGEVNNGGEMVESTIRTVRPMIPYKAVHASRGKRVRAEPVSALDEQGRVHHVGSFPDLEDQLCNWEPEGVDWSPDRLEAFVWAVVELDIAAAGLFEREHFRYFGFEEKPHPAGQVWQEQCGEYVLTTPTGVKRWPSERVYRFAVCDPSWLTRDADDWFVLATCGVTPDAELLLLDVVRVRALEADGETLIAQNHGLWRPAYQGLEEALVGQDIAARLVRGGLPIRPLKPGHKDPWTRALTAVTRYREGTVYHRKDAAWLNTWEAELLSFKLGSRSAQVAVASYAALELYQPEGPPPPKKPEVTRMIDEILARHEQDQEGESWL